MAGIPDRRAKRLKMLDINRSMAPDFLTGGGEMGALMRAHDWAAPRRRAR